MIQDNIKQDLLTARKSKDAFTMSITQTILGEFARLGKDLEDVKAIAVLRKMVASLKEVGSADADAEIAYIERYLPKLMSEEDLKALTLKFVQDNPDAKIKDYMAYVKNMGVDMKMANKVFNAL